MKNLLNLCYPFSNSLSFIIYFLYREFVFWSASPVRNWNIRMDSESECMKYPMFSELCFLKVERDCARECGVASCRDHTGEGLTLKKRLLSLMLLVSFYSFVSASHPCLKWTVHLTDHSGPRCANLIGYSLWPSTRKMERLRQHDFRIQDEVFTGM